MTIHLLLERLGTAGIRLRNSGGELRVAGNRAALDAELVGQLRVHKAALLELVGGEGDEWWTPPAPAAANGHANGDANISRCVHELFAAQAARTPDAVALSWRGERLTYAELDARANRLAHALRRRGVGPEVRVGVSLPRTPSLVVALLGVLKAGGAYVPLDPVYPRERLGYMMDDAEIALVLTESRLVDRLPGAAAATLLLDAEAGALAAEPEDAPASGVLPGNLSHLIFTSGSTGRPKGVMIRHSSTAVLVHWLRESVSDEERAAVLFSTSINFDVSVAELFGTLCWGGTLVLAENALELATVGEPVVYASMVPTAAAELLRAGAIPPTVRTLNLGGEALPNALAQGLYGLGTVEKVGNLYGPTEDTTYSTYSLVEKGGSRVLVGRPVAGARAFVLDGRLRPVPLGVVGELYLTGEGLSRGYARRPGLTAERFLPCPFGPPGARMYRVMDRVLWRENGALEYLGRTDFQVKVRGHRIELGEIETRLREHPAVRDAVVLAREDEPGDVRLVAYFVAAADDAGGGGEAGGAVDAEALRAHLLASLPAYMVPAAYVRLAALPLTPNGKLDRAALPAPGGDAFATRGYEAPLGDTETALAAIWAEVLGVERVGRHDHFFDLGGHSLLAVQVISRVRQALGVQVELGDLFARPALADFARGLEQADRADLPPIEPAGRGERLALSFAQQRLWFVEQLGGVGAAYHIPTRLRLRGALHRDALVRALDRVVARHEALRTTFHAAGGQPVQRIVPVEEARFHLLEHDLGGCAAPEAELRRVMAEESGAPFDLERGPLIRGRLVRWAEDDHLLLVTMHHIVSDGWSMGVFTRELGALYGAFQRGEPDPLPPLPVQYADFAAWQRRWVDGPVLQAQAEYWTAALAGAPGLLELPTDHPRPARQDFSGAGVGVELDRELSAGLKALAQRHGATLFMTLLAGWAVVLSRLAGQDDVVIGTPTAGRGRREIEGLIGFFVNTLALRLDLSDAPAVAELLGRAKERALGAQHHQDIPFEQVVELLDVGRSLAHHPLFQVMFSWQNTPQGGGASLPGLEVGGVGRVGAGPPQVQAKFDLSLALGERDGRIVGTLEYATALFERATVERFAGHLRRALEAMAADEHQAVDRLPLLPDAERRLVLDEWNATGRPYPTGACVHDLFRTQAARTPTAIALSWRGERVTYAELAARANRISNALRRRGVGPEVRVGICLPRTPELVAAMLGVLGAGGAYVPLDPAYPRERLGYMLEDAAVALVLTDSALADRLPEDAPPLLLLDLERDVIAAESADAPESDVLPENLSHVIFTSGSTGRPKGVMIRHSSVVVLLHWLRENVTDEERSSVLFSTSINFDVSVAEVFGTLAWGGKLVIAENALELATLGEDVVHVSMVPSAAAELLRSGGIPASVKTLNLGGEPLPNALAQGLYGLETVEKVGNLYGPTEDTTYSTYYVVPRGAEQVLVGTPVANTLAYVLDRHLQPVPAGAVGELYLAGGGLSRGYANRPGMTAERFVPCPFGAPGGRMYRVMDRVRRRADGEIEYLGRLDFQVKVRGYRIELGEIEARLAEHPGVRAPVVLVREDAPGDRRLVAYYLADQPVAVDALKAHLADRLPGYMVPAAFVWMEAYPRTPNGKVDRRALPAPEGDAYAARAYEAPVGETEQALAGIWAEVLGAERVGRRDDFFELGGHSLLAVQVISRVRQALSVEAGLGDLFLRPVLADFARGLETAARADLPPIEPVERGAGLPLSFAQQRLWFVDRLEGAGTAYHLPARLRMRGELDRDALVRALDRIVARHEALRTTFPEHDGVPAQRIAPAEESPFHLVEHDLRGDPQAARELRRIVAEETDAPFDLARGPLIRGRLVRLADDDHALLITMHHIVSDGWSMGVFARELGALYAAFRAGRADPLPPLPVQYADYATWQRRWVDGDVVEEQAEYWRATLAGAPELLELPADRPRPPRQDFAGAVVGVELDEELTGGLKALGARHGTTLFMTLLAGWAAVLGRLAGQEDVVIGTPTANRGQREIEGLIGFFVNTLALRVDLAGSPTVAQLLERVKERTLGAQHHQDIPFEQVVELVDPARSLSHTPLFQVVFSWQNTPAEGLELQGLTLGSATGANGPAGPASRVTAKFDLTLTLSERGGRIAGSVEYATALFDRATVERFAAYLRRALEAMVADEHQAVDRLPLLPEAERRLVLEEWNATGQPYPAGACVHDLFRAQAARTPTAIALSWRGERVTYAELAARANRISNVLRGRGVGPEVRVGICLPRTPELVAAMLGVFGAGGAYVPLDPAYPRERLGYMLEDAAVALILTDSTLADRLPEDAPALLLLDLERDAVAAESADAPESGGGPENLSHVIFTSGSTGRPKGVMIRHSSVVVLLHWLRENVTDEERSSVLFSTSINFDVSVAEVFGTLAWGGKLVIAENALELATLDEDVVHVSMVPSAAAELLRSGGIPASVKTLNLGGEPLPNALAQGLYALETVEKVGNLYGPTEDTTYSTYYVVPRGAEQVLVGTPVANTQAYALDRHLQPVPAGAVGELYLAGDGLSRGYANRPGMTAERFVPCPFGAPGGRMYRVMDRVRRRADGELEYLGRTDFQVKVRGYRIELGEIEARLAEHSGVRAPVVLVREDTPGDRRLVAYYLANELTTVDALKAHLADRLPGYMVPAAYVWMEAYPRTPNGKVDRRALPAPEGDAYAERAYAAPLGETEQALAEIWSGVLGAERVGRWDDFFELGGHSLLAVQVIARVRQVLEVEVQLGDLFTRPVLADFARGLAAAARAELPPIERVARTPDLPLSFAQQRLWFLERLGSAGTAYHIPMRLRLKGGLDRDALVRALDRIVARHEALRTVFVEVDGQPVQRILPERSGFRLLEHDLAGGAGARPDPRPLLAEEAGAPFDLERGPLIRGRLVRLAADDHLLLITMHHIVSDGWSMGVFTRELGALYAAFRAGEADPLPPLPVQYADYAAWQRRWVDGEVLKAQAEYWTATLAGAPELLELPADHARPARQDFSGGVVGIELHAELTAGLKALGQRHGATLFMTLLAGWAAVLGRLSGQHDVVVGTPTANRGRSEIEGLIGFFVNTLALRVDLSGAPTVAEALGRVKARALEAQHHPDIPFEQVVELLQPVRSLSHTPLFQVMFTWQNAPEHELRLPGLSLGYGGAAPGASSPAAAPATRTTAKFDLSLSLSERDGRIVGALEYAAALFERTTVERFAGYLRRALEEMAADEAQPVDRLALVPESERRLLLEEWNRTEAVDPRESCVHELFEAQARRTPGAAALLSGGGALTYAELNAAANRLARRLRAAGVGPERAVGVMLERSAELVVALLAVLKAGGAYLPLDPALPAARRAALLADAGAAVLVTRDPRLEGFTGTLVSPADAEGEDGGDLRQDLPPAALAYVIYTSGSTGAPKGVGVAHAQAAAHCRAAAAVYGLTPADRVLHFAAVGFDVSLEQLLAPLSAGACVVLRGAEVPTPLELARQAVEQGMTVINPPTAYWHQLVAEPAALELLARSVRLVIAGGEAMSPAAARDWAAGPAAGVRLLNAYGPTETVVTCAAYEVPPSLPEGAVHVPVGRPLPGRAAYVLDGRSSPAPLGVHGELCIGGIIARGYLGRPAATAEAFVPDPFSPVPGARMYRTGDRARWLAAGELEFLGRTDFQVKVRGFRIEPGEIEARLAEHPDVREAVVLAREDAPGEKRLVAYVVGGEAAAAEVLRAHLAAALPEYMVPAAYVRLEQLPLTPNGKLDRKALPAPEGDAFTTSGYEAPVGYTETALAEIWAQALGVERVGRHDNFFELGGHSLLAVRVVARTRQVLGAEVALAHMFSNPTVESLAARLRGPEAQLHEDRAIAIRPAGSQPPLFLAYEGTGSTAYAQVLHPHLDGDIPVYALPAPPLSGTPLRTVEAMATRLVRMIREVQPSGPYRVAGWSFGGVLAYEVASQLIGHDEAVEFVGMLDSYHPALARAEPDDPAQEHALLLHVLRMAEPSDAGARLDADDEGAAALDGDLEAFVTRCREQGLLAGHVTVAHARKLRDRLRGHQRALRDYDPQPVPLPVHLFPARQSPDPDLSRGWQALLPEKSLRVTPVPGTHLSMMRAPNAEALGAALTQAIHGARAGAGALPADGHSAVLKLQGGKAGVAPLFCVPGAGTSVTSFIGLLGALDPSWPVYGLQPRGLDGRTVPHSTVQAAAENYLRAVRQACPEGPLHLLGHSFGGWVAFEMALRLREAGRPVGSLTILDSEVPDEYEDPAKESGGKDAFLKLVEILELTAERSFGIGSAEVDALDQAGRLKLLHQKMLQHGLLNARSTYDVLYGPFWTFARCLRTTYRPSGEYPDRLRLVLVNDPRMDEEANQAQFAEIVRAWRRWAPGLEFSTGAGNHITALKPPHVATLAAYLAEDRG